MSENPEQPVDLFVVEPMTQLDGSPVPHKEGPGGKNWRERLGQPGLLALAEGLALLCCFFFPWFYFPAVGFDGPALATVNYSGWGAALGISIGIARPLALFVNLWLIPLTALSLLALTWVYVQRRFSVRLMLGIPIALSVLALLVEAGFYWQVFLLKPAFFNNSGPSTLDVMGVLWGYWATVAATVAAIAASVYLLWRANHSSYAA